LAAGFNSGHCGYGVALSRSYLDIQPRNNLLAITVQFDGHNLTSLRLFTDFWEILVARFSSVVVRDSFFRRPN